MTTSKTKLTLDWPEKRRIHAKANLPWGYVASNADPLRLLPDPSQLGDMEKALSRLDDGGSLRETAEWLTQTSRKKISHQSLSRIWREMRKDADTVRGKKLKAQNSRKPGKTKADRDAEKLRQRQTVAKRNLTITQNKLAKLEQAAEEPVVAPAPSSGHSVDTEPKSAEVSEEFTAGRPIAFQPFPGPQTDFLAATEREVLYGGSAGGGKSYGLLGDPLRYFDNPNFNGLILRRTTDELRELKWKSREIYELAFPGAKWREKDSQWHFPSGARLWLTYLERDDDVLRYQGQSFSYIAVDELTQYATPFAWNYLRSRLRTTDPTLPIFMRATTNPGGPGHGWVKRMFIDPAPAGKAFWAKDLETGKTLKYPDNHPTRAGEPLFKRRFIPASLKDNPVLYKQGDYEANLLSLPEDQRRQLLEGDWDVASGAAFKEFRRRYHVCEPFEIPSHWRRFRSCDYGYNSFSAVHWYAIDPAYETLYVYRELYVTGKTGTELGNLVRETEVGERIDYGVLDSSCWHTRGNTGPTIAEEMNRTGGRWRPSDRGNGSRVNGKNRLHQLLRVDENLELPGIVFFNNCRQIIADLPLLPVDPRGTEDIDPRYASDHAYDSIRYGIMTRPHSGNLSDIFGDSMVHSGYQPVDTVLGI